MSKRYQNRSLVYLIILLASALIFGISLPIGLVMYIVIPGFFSEGTFSPDLIYTWTGAQIAGIIVGLVLFLAFEVFCVITVVNIIKEFIRRRKENKNISSSVLITESNFESEYRYR